MAYSFFGTMTSYQWEAFRAFSLIQKADLQLRRLWLQKEQTKIGIFKTEYGDDFNPVSFTANAGSYAAKLLQAYKILGGVPEKDMLLRTSDNPVFLTKSSNLTSHSDGTVDGGFSESYSNGRRDRGGQRYDRDLGLRVEKLKNWQYDAIKFKREHLEYKIKRALDCSDQLQNEIALIDRLLGDGTGSIDYQILQVEVQMFAPGTSNVIDNMNDPFGLSIGKIADFSYADSVSQAKQEGERGQ